MNSYEKSLTLGLTGTDEEKVSILSKITVNPMPTSTLANRLLEFDILYVGRNNQTKGAIANVENPLIDKLYATITNPDMATVMWTHTQKWGPAFYDTVMMLRMSGLLTEQQANEVFTLAGGLLFPSLTLEKFQSDKAAYEKEAGDSAKWDNFLTLFNSARNSYNANNLDEARGFIQQIKDGI